MADDELALRRAAERAAQAKTLIDSVLLNEAFAELRQAYLNKWFTTAAGDTDTRERLWVAQTVLTKVRGHFDTIINDGKIAEAQLADIEAKAQRQKRA